jgi:hypothetical protein
MQVETRADGLEAFTISLLPEDAFRGSLRISWEKLTVSVPYAFRQ